MIEIPRFVKWAGGKQQLLEQFKPLFPKKFKNYFEPFVGSGAVACFVIQTFHPGESILSDINEELITAFNVVKNNSKELISELKEHQKEHREGKEKYYYKIRDVNPELLSDVQIAARFIYLNRTCFNGLYRVNSKNKFNVPIGDYKNPDIVQEQNIENASKMLKKTEIKLMSFEKIVDLARKGDFVYFDPPYHTAKKGKNFTTYTKDNFLEKDQEKLADIFKKLSKKGCLCMLSNSDTELIRELYKEFNIHTVRARRMINSNAKGRGEINELVITNY